MGVTETTLQQRLGGPKRFRDPLSSARTTGKRLITLSSGGTSWRRTSSKNNWRVRMTPTVAWNGRPPRDAL